MSAHDDDDLLARAMGELYDAGSPPLDELRQTRRRIMEAASRVERPSRRWLWLVGQLAAFLLAATALAATTGQLRPMMNAVRALLAHESPRGEAFESHTPRASQEGSAPRESLGSREAQRDPSPVAPAVAPTPEADELGTDALATVTVDAPQRGPAATGLPSAASVGEELSRARGGVAPSSTGARGQGARETATAETPASPGISEALGATTTDAPLAEDADLTLYREAHRAHFVARDPSAGLSAWDRYLAAYPHGAFALEARYNRALCLVRLGRHDAAIRALAPFAAGTVGSGYRREEAQALLDALEAR